MTEAREVDRGAVREHLFFRKTKAILAESNNMKRCEAGKIIVAVLFLITWSVQFPKSVNAEGGECVKSDFNQFQRDIPSLYLINGMHLTKEQTGGFISILQKAKLVEEAAHKEIETIEKKYQKDIDRDIDRSRKLRKADKELSEVRKDMREKLDALADEVYALLTPSQQDIVNHFKPCFIPAQDFRNPTRIGQATDDTSPGEKVLTRLRRVSEHKMAQAKEHALDNMVRQFMYKRHIEYSEKAAQKVRKELSEHLEEVLPQALALSDVDFDLQKSALSKELLPLETERTPAQIQWAIKTYLLNTGNIEVLQSRLKED